MPPLVITPRAIERFMERVGGTQAQAEAALASPAVQIAARFGARCARTAKARILLRFCDGLAVVITVVPLDYTPAQLIPFSHGGVPWLRRNFTNTGQ
ncbi:hypothetical protein [Novosphingobium sp. 9]|uniref:hypothetical protein n=1 Tax=Novosphingobium sp. 9 TaxID=2025349 RepID=UPI0021B552B9|nr:hypothetical protein [Novosphingobium sp. 9]